MNNFKEEFKEKLPKVYSDKLLECLFYEVYTKNSYLEEACSISRNTATAYLNKLENVGLVVSEKVGRERIYKNERLIKILAES